MGFQVEHAVVERLQRDREQKESLACTLHQEYWTLREIYFGEDRLRQREADNVVAELRDEELEFQKNSVHCLPMISDRVNLEVRHLKKT